MIEKILLVLSLGLLALPGAAQTLRLIDKITRQPLPNGAIYNQSRQVTATTDARGQADLSAFAAADTLFFRHLNYRPAVYPYRQLAGMHFTVELTENQIFLGEVVVAAHRWEQDQTEVPQRIEKIAAKEIALQNPQTAADLLGATGQVYIQKSQQAGGSPMLRGFSTNRVLLVVDGVRMNNAIFRTGNLQNVISLDAGSVESAEVLFGPGSVMYGSDAIGGVMDFHTLGPRLSSTGKAELTGSSFTRFSSANREKTGHVHLNVGLQKWAFATSITYSDYDDLRTGSRGNRSFLRPDYQAVMDGEDVYRVNPDPQRQVASGYGQYNLMQKVRFKPAKAWNLEYAFHHSATSDAPRYDRLYLKHEDGTFTHAQWYYGPQRWTMNRLAVQHNQSALLYDQLRVVAAHQCYQESRHDRRMGDNRLRHQTENVDAYSLNLDLDKKLGKKLNLFYGAEAVYNRVGSRAHREHIKTGAFTPIATRYPDGATWQSYAAYAQVKYNLHPGWVLNGGVRYSYVGSEAAFDTTLFAFPFTTARVRAGAVNGSLGAVFKPSAAWQLYLNGATGYRAPNIDDIGKVFESEPGSVVVPNPALQPEYAYSAEVGTAGLLGNAFKMNLSVYYTFLDGALARRNYTFNGQDSIAYDGQRSRVQAIQNLASAYVWGVQAGLDAQLGRGFKWSGTLTYQRGEEQSDESLTYYPLRHVPPTFGSTHLRYERKRYRVDLYAVYNAEMKYDRLALSEREDSAPYAKDAAGLPFVPGWYTLNCKAAWYIHPHLVLNAGVENITDQLYRPYASGISAPGRNFILALRAQL